MPTVAMRDYSDLLAQTTLFRGLDRQLFARLAERVEPLRRASMLQYSVHCARRAPMPDEVVP
jgi:hypothetical protein